MYGVDSCQVASDCCFRSGCCGMWNAMHASYMHDNMICYDMTDVCSFVTELKLKHKTLLSSGRRPPGVIRFLPHVCFLSQVASYNRDSR
jgi:hypothetical protein